MNEFELSVLEYLGKLEDGVLAIISVMYNSQYYEASFFYTDKDMVFTISDELESQVGEIKNHPKYQDLLRKLIRITVPYNDIYGTLDPVDFTKWVRGVIELEDLEKPMVIDESQIKPVPRVE
jgi:hypothetical protein